jgi:sulfate adenylyltransferase subunit 1 (EFTu-like GTPase family)
MSVRQVKDTNRDVGGDHVDDGDGTVEFVSALLYDTMYLRDDYGNPLEEDTGKDYTNE